MKKITHIITGLNTGGAEGMLYKLLSYTDLALYEIDVISLLDIGPVGKKIEDLGIPVRALGMRPNAPNPFALVRLAWWLRRNRPDLIQTWMYHADLFGGVAAKLGGVSTPVIWGIRTSNLDHKFSKKSTILTVKISAFLSRWIPQKIICCSEASKVVHINMGYDRTKTLVIPNGFDLEAYRPDPQKRLSFRKELHISEDVPVIGYVARFDPQKNHQTFFRAAGLLALTFPDVQFLLCGKGMDWENQEIVRWIEEADIKDRCHLLGGRDDISHIMAALDIATSTASYGEGFPNIIGEAMASGIPCVVTDVGGSASIVGDTGFTIPPKNPPLLARGWKQILELEKSEYTLLRVRARERIRDNYSIERIAREYSGLYTTLWND